MRWLNKIINETFPTTKLRGRSVREMHAEGELARPEPTGPSGSDVLKSMPDQQGAEAPVQPDPLVQADPAGAPASPMNQNLGTPSAQDVVDTPAPPLPEERRTRARNINLDFLDAQNVDDIGRVLDANASKMDWGKDPIKSLDETRSRVEGKQERIFRDVLQQDPAALSDEQLVAGRDVMLTLADRQATLAEMISTNKASQEQILEFDLVSDQAVMVQDYMQGKIREAARALNSMKVVAQTINTMDPVRVGQAATGSNVVHRAQTVLDMRARGATPGEVVETAGRMSRLKESAAAVVNLRSGSLLTGIRTQVLNAGNNAFHRGYRTLVIKPIAAGMGSVRTRGEANPDKVYLSEVSAEMVGTFQALSEAISIGLSTLKHGTITNKGEFVSMYGGRKIDELAEGAGHAGSAITRLMGMEPGYVAKGVDLYQRGVEAASFGLLTASDDFFKTLSYKAAIYSLVQRDAARRNLTGQAAVDHMDMLMSDVGHSFHQEAMKEAEIATFTNREDIAPFLTAGADFIVKIGNMVPLTRWFFPFVRTPTAILDRSIKNSPLAPMQAKYWERINAGGPDADMANAELAAGVSFTAITAGLVSMGLMTGNGPSAKDDPTGAMRQTLRATGWTPNSVLIGDKYVSLKRGLDPVMLIPLSIAQAVEAAQYSKDEADVYDYTIGAALTVASQTADASYMQGLEQVMNLINGRLNYTDYLAREVTTMIPAMAKDIDAVVRFVDGEEGRPYVPKTDDLNVALAMHLRARVPFVEPPMVARYWDGTVATPGGGELMFAWNTATPIASSYLYNTEGRAGDYATSALVNGRVPVGRVSPKITVDPRTGASVDLLQLPKGWELYDDLVQKVGAQRRAAVESITGTKKFRDLSDEREAGPNSDAAMALSQAVRAGKQRGTQLFMQKILSPDFDWSDYGGEEAEAIMSGARAGELLRNRAIGADTPDELEEMRDLGLKGVPTRSQLSPPQGEGATVEKQFDPLTQETIYVPKI